MPELRISLLGTSRISWGRAGPPVHLTGPARMLMSFLVLHRNRTHMRERLAGLLWGDFEESRARRCFNTALWRLRKSLAPQRHAQSPEVLTVTSNEVGFNTAAPYWLDVAVFDEAARGVLASEPGSTAAAAVPDLEAALALYGGELLEDCDADWVLPERQRLTDAYIAGLRWLMLHHEHTGSALKAIESGLRLLHVDPLREDVHRALIGLYCATGLRQKALKQYDYCRDVLASELGVTPAPETELFCRRILAGVKEQVAPQPRAAGEPRQLMAEALDRLNEAVSALQAASRLIHAADRELYRGRNASAPRTR
ncbi:MAG: AfsR/SARP family transcriptional regulator [Geminicoccales bacterium]